MSFFNRNKFSKKADKYAVAFVGQVVPDTSEYNSIPGFTRAGNLAQIGFLDGILHANIPLGVVLSSQPVAYFPQNKTIIKRGRPIELFPGVSVKLVPLINLFLVRDILRACYIYAYLLTWSLRNLRKVRIVLTYNLSVPPILPLLMLARLTGSKIVAILYDVAWPEGLTYGWIKTFIYKILTQSADSCIPRLDGRIVITDSIAKHFAPGKHFLRVDGGITELVQCRLFPLVPAKDDEDLVLLFAGGLDNWNHIPMMLDMMRRYPEQKLKLWIAGNGALVKDVLEAQKTDERILYHGVLNHDQLFELYKKADILLNLRNTKDPAMAYHFPSKLLEILTVGRPVISTPVAHAREVYGAYCFVLDEETPQALFERIQEITALSPEERLAFGQRARDYMLREHTWKRQGEKIRAYLEQEVLGE